MSEKLTVIPAKQLIKAIEKAGFQKVRQRGSHVFMQHSDGRATVVPLHKGEDLGPGLTRKILRDTELSKKELLALLRKH